MKAYLITIICLLAAVWLFAADYYAGLDNLTGQALKDALHQRIKGQTVYPYFADSLSLGVGELLCDLDADPAIPGNVILFYTGRSQPAQWADHGDRFDYAAYGIPQSDTWNREHLWAKSHGFSEMTDIAYTDVHHLRLADRSVNGSKGAKDFDWGGAPDPEAPDSYTDYASWAPRDEVKGDLARALVDMDGRDSGDDTPYDLQLVERTGTEGPCLGRLSTLLEWNELDPPDDRERARNEMVYQKYQHNRNPFIDHPEYVERIWGKPDQTPRLSVSAPWLDLGDVVVGESSAPAELWATGVHMRANCRVTTTSRIWRLQGTEGDWRGDLSLKPREGFFNKLVSVRFQPAAPGVAQGELCLNDGDAECRIPITARGIEPGTRAVLEARWDGKWDGWTTYSRASNRNWALGSYDDRQYAKAGGFKADVASDDWLLSPPVKLAGMHGAAMRFETAKSHDDDIEGLEVLVSDDYTSGDPVAAHWTALQPQLSTGRYEWASSGWLDLSLWDGKEIHVAFRYRCTSPEKASSWEVDDLRLTAAPLQ